MFASYPRSKFAPCSPLVSGLSQRGLFSAFGPQSGAQSHNEVPNAESGCQRRAREHFLANYLNVIDVFALSLSDFAVYHASHSNMFGRASPDNDIG